MGDIPATVLLQITKGAKQARKEIQIFVTCGSLLLRLFWKTNLLLFKITESTACSQWSSIKENFTLHNIWQWNYFQIGQGHSFILMWSRLGRQKRSKIQRKIRKGKGSIQIHIVIIYYENNSRSETWERNTIEGDKNDTSGSWILFSLDF